MRKEASYFGALIATLLYSVAPQMIHRTTAGIPEIESLGMPFFWLAFYLFISAWESKSLKNSLMLAAGAGLSTGLMIWSWGGYRYIFMSIFLATFFVFFFQKMEKKNVAVYGVWLAIAVIAQMLKFRSLISPFLSFTDIMPATIVFVFLIVDLLHYEEYFKQKLRFTEKWPKQALTIVISLIALSIIASLVFGPMFVPNKVVSVVNTLVHPYGEGRIGLTVAENKAPYFTEISDSFSVSVGGLSISLFWLFFFGTIAMFYFATKHFDKRNKLVLNSTFIIFLVGFIFSRISTTSLMNGDNFISKLFYFGSLIVLICGIFYVFKKEQGNLEETFHKLDFSYLLLISAMFFMIISMRGAIRLLFIITPFVMIASGFFIAKMAELSIEKRAQHGFYLFGSLFIIGLLIVAFAGLAYSTQSKGETKYTVPGIYEQQWQRAMSWVRDNTAPMSIFVHWWDYGYWIQTIGERPTVTDGGHIVSFWDHVSARYLMTAESEQTAFQMMKSFNVSYVLFDSTDIGKYAAYASIGSDKTGKDRLTYIPTFSMDSSQTQELKNETVYAYTGGGFVLDKDITINNVLLPAGKAGIVGFLLTLDKRSDVKSVKAVAYYNGQRYDVPVNYYYANYHKVKVGSDGLDAVLFMMPSVTGDRQIIPLGGAMFLSEKVANSEFGRAYLLNETAMTLAYQEDNVYVKQVKSNNFSSDFLLAGQLMGPIKIFKAPDLSNIQYYPEYSERKGLEENDFGRLDYLGK